MSEFIEVAEVNSLLPGQARTVEVRGRRLALANVAGQFHAVDDTCPHRGGPLGAGFLDGRTLHCPLHGWGFDVTTGACDVRPDKPVRRYPAEIREGRVYVDLAGAQPKAEQPAE